VRAVSNSAEGVSFHAGAPQRLCPCAAWNRGEQSSGACAGVAVDFTSGGEVRAVGCWSEGMEGTAECSRAPARALKNFMGPLFDPDSRSHGDPDESRRRLSEMPRPRPRGSNSS
jgi:hypothetical protein